MPKDTYKTRTEFIVVGVVQLVEQQIVVLFVVGSSPIVHPSFDALRAASSMVEQLTLNQ